MNTPTDKPITTVSVDGKMIITQYPYSNPSIVNQLFAKYLLDGDEKMNTPTDTLTDRELDAMVAEKVMGRAVVALDEDFTTKEMPSYLTPIEQYTTDANDDYKVLCKVRDTWRSSKRYAFMHELLEGYRRRLNSDEPLLFSAMHYQVGDYAKAALKALEGVK